MHRIALSITLLVASAACANVIGLQDVTEDPVLREIAFGKAETPVAEAHLGNSVALSGNTLVVGAHEQNNTGAVHVYVRTGATWGPPTQLKARTPAPDELFGASVALSGDTLAVGAPGRGGTGAIDVFIYDGATWGQPIEIKAPTPASADLFGTAVALSGKTLVVGAPGRNSSAGAAYVFVHNGTTWDSPAELTPSVAAQGDGFGYSVALSPDTGGLPPDMLAVGAPDRGNGTGAVYVFVPDGTLWRPQGQPIEASNADDGDNFGFALALAGNTLVVGAPDEASAAKQINGNKEDNSADSAGAAYVLDWNGTSWAERAYVKASNAGPHDNFGSSVALSGNALAVGAPDEGGSSAGINKEDNDYLHDAGAIYVFLRIDGMWVHQAYVKASSPGSDHFGSSVALSRDTLAVGAIDEASGASGILENDETTEYVQAQERDSVEDSGAVYIFVFL